MSANPFATPAPPGQGINWSDHLGVLLLVEPVSFEPNVKTSLGEKDAVRADVTVLDGPNAGETMLDTLIFPKVLVNQTKSKIGEKVLGRLGQGEQKPGQSPPWMLLEASEQDVATGVSYLNHRTGQQVAQPAPAQQAPAQQPAPEGQQAQAQAWGQAPAAAQQQGASVPF